MQFFRRAAGSPERLGVFPGSFNPPTVAHLAIARAALVHVDEVVFVLPRVFPHKHYSGASFEQRIGLLLEAYSPDEPFSVAASDGGMFIEIAHECRGSYGPAARLSFLCGRDAAERIAAWDHGAYGAFPQVLREFDLLVAARGGAYRPPEEIAARVRPLAVDTSMDPVSATEIRDRIAAGQPWDHLVPPALREGVRRIYGAASTGPGSQSET